MSGKDHQNGGKGVEKAVGRIPGDWSQMDRSLPEECSFSK